MVGTWKIVIHTFLNISYLKQHRGPNKGRQMGIEVYIRFDKVRRPRGKNLNESFFRGKISATVKSLKTLQVTGTYVSLPRC